MKKIAQYLGYFFAVIFMLLLESVVSIDAYKAVCENGDYKNYENCPAYDITRSILASVFHGIKNYEAVVTAIATVVIAVFTWRLFIATRNLWTAAIAQGDATERAITESGRAATGIRDVAGHMALSAKASMDGVESMRTRTAQQMRAYITVFIGSGIYQDENLRFAIHPQMINAGQTPAHNLRYWAKAAIAPFPLPDDFVLEPGEFPEGGSVVGPHQQLELNGVVDNRVPDDDIAAIKAGNEKRVHIWGVVKYIDAFNDIRETKFCHSLRWYKIGDQEKTMGTYARRHNEAN